MYCTKKIEELAAKWRCGSKIEILVCWLNRDVVVKWRCGGKLEIR